jgi:hypothetical protein
MGNQLYQLVYYSRNQVPGSPDNLLGQVRNILAASRRNNAEAGITGALMFNAGCFAQVLEGRREVVEATFERIQRDDRHGEVSLLAFEPIEARQFGHWSMGFVGADPGNAASFADVAAASGFDPSRASGSDVLRTLRDLALEDEAAVA